MLKQQELTAPCGRGQDGTDAELQVSRVRAASVRRPGSVRWFRASRSSQPRAELDKLPGVPGGEGPVDVADRLAQPQQILHQEAGGQRAAEGRGESRGRAQEARVERRRQRAAREHHGAPNGGKF